MSRDGDHAGTWDAPHGLHGYTWRAAASRATVLLQHGYAEHAGRYVDHYNRLIPSLVEQGYDVYAFDMAGHGCSLGERGMTDIGKMVEAHLQARRLLASPAKPLFLFGHSLGGLVTAASAAIDQSRLAGVILSAPALPASSASTRLMARLTAAVAPRRAASPLQSADGISQIPDEVKAYLEDPAVFRRAVPMRLAATALTAANRIWHGAGRWTAPTLIMHGTADTYTSPKGSERLIAAIPATDKTFHSVPDGRHELLNDTSRDEMLAATLSWLRDRVARREAAAGQT